jgi:hypothetical protein
MAAALIPAKSQVDGVSMIEHLMAAYPPSTMIGSTFAVMGGLVVAMQDAVSAEVTQVTAIPVAPATTTSIGLAIALIGFGTAGLPHAYNSLKLLVEDRKDRRASERAALEHDQRIIDLANKVNRHLARLQVLENVEASNRELRRQYDDLKALYEREVNEDLKPAVAANTAAIVETKGKVEALETASNSGIFPVYPPARVAEAPLDIAPDADHGGARA